ncbi:MAG: hypothetical protein ABJA79_06340 [Parafilimonas sp.]
MQELLTVKLPDGRGWEMPRYLAKKLYDFIKQKQKTDIETGIPDFESEWLKNLISEDQVKVVKEH